MVKQSIGWVEFLSRQWLQQYLEMVTKLCSMMLIDLTYKPKFHYIGDKLSQSLSCGYIKNLTTVLAQI